MGFFLILITELANILKGEHSMYKSIEKFISHHGWTKASRLNYLHIKINQGKSKDEIKSEAVDKYKIIPNMRQFNSTWNTYERIQPDIKW